MPAARNVVGVAFPEFASDAKAKLSFYAHAHWVVQK